jgi:SAM-dependent methyltransferase
MVDRTRPTEATEPTEPGSWRWDPTLYAGSAAHYPVGRVGYPAALIEELVAALHLDGTGRLLDVGCGPGSLTLLLAPHVAEAVGVDADADMLVEAARIAGDRQIHNVSWRHLRAEELPADLPPVDVVTLAQSFHWMDRPRVATAVRGLLNPGGALVHLHANTHEGVPEPLRLAHPQPPRPAITELVRRYLGPGRRAGQGLLPNLPGGDEPEIYGAAGFHGPQRVEVAGVVVTRTTEELVSGIYSLSSSAPHLFGDRLPAFDRDLRALLDAANPDGLFDEQLRPFLADIWR